ITLCSFASSATRETFVVVGGGQRMRLAPRSCARGFLRTYRLTPSLELELLHATELDDAPLAMCPFHGRLLVAVGSALRIYDIGKKKLLRKLEAKGFPNLIVNIHTQGNRIVVADVQESLHYAVYVASENRITVFADDTAGRFVTASCMLDYDTIAGGDKFGSLFVARLPRDVSEEVDEDPAGNRVLYEKGYLNGAAYKLEHVAEFHVGETVTSVARAALVAGGREVLLYTTLLGRVGALVPFASKEDADFFQQLEMQLRAAAPPLAGRDHLAFRSAYRPVHATVDGDLCERFLALPADRRRAIADDLDRTVAEVAKKIEDLRNRVAF
ncbi:Splicing factor 3B subunit 3, partial [Cladochytrium tenue]